MENKIENKIENKMENKKQKNHFLVNCKSERGNVESFLVLIPLIFLFLLVFQLVVALYQRNVAIYEVQSIANRIATSGEVININSHSKNEKTNFDSFHFVEANINLTHIDIPGGGALIKVDKYVEIPIFTELFRDTRFRNLFLVHSLAYSEIN